MPELVDDQDKYGEVIARELQQAAGVLSATRVQAPLIAEIAARTIASLSRGNKVLLCGNGGSAADAQHIATELVARYTRDRQPFGAIALAMDPTFLTAMSNDVGFEHVFARQVEALGKPGDVLWALSTSGNSANVLAAAAIARQIGLTTVGFTSSNGGALPSLVDICLHIPAQDTARVQEAHMAVAHIICGLIEQAICV